MQEYKNAILHPLLTRLGTVIQQFLNTNSNAIQL